MSESPVQVAASLAEEERHELVQSARLLHTRLGKLIAFGEPAMGFDLPTLVSLLGRVRDALEEYRRAQAVHAALIEADAASREDARRLAWWDDFAALQASNERLREVVALLDSMILSGESHSASSLQRMRDALAAPW